MLGAKRERGGPQTQAPKPQKPLNPKLPNLNPKPEIFGLQLEIRLLGYLGGGGEGGLEVAFSWRLMVGICELVEGGWKPEVIWV